MLKKFHWQMDKKTFAVAFFILKTYIEQRESRKKAKSYKLPGIHLHLLLDNLFADSFVFRSSRNLSLCITRQIRKLYSSKMIEKTRRI